MNASELIFQTIPNSNGSSSHSNSYTPRFSVAVLDKVEKAADSQRTCYFLTVSQFNFGEFQDENELKRTMDDFRSLDRRIRTDAEQNYPGIITPRLSNKETAVIETVPDNNARFMGECAAERVLLQRYINAVLAHPVVGQNQITEAFLTLPDFSAYSNYKFSLARRFAGALEDLRTSDYVDPDVTLNTGKDRLGPNVNATADFHNAFTLQNINKKNLSAVMADLALSFTSNGTGKDPVTKLFLLSTDAIKQEEVCPDLNKIRETGQPLTAFLQYGWHLAYWNGELTLGTFLKHHIAQLDSTKDMLNRRRALLHDLEKAKNTMEHAKPPKREAAQAALAKLEGTLQICTMTAHEEVQRLHDVEVKGFRQALIDYAESQMKAAQETYEVLLDQIRKLHEFCPDLPTSL